MIDLDELKRLAGLVTPETDPGSYAFARIGIAQLCFDHLTELIAALETAALVRDEGWLAERITSSLAMYWPARPIDAARAIIVALPKDEV